MYTALTKLCLVVTLSLVACWIPAFAESASPLLVTISPEVRSVERVGREEQVRYLPAKEVAQGQQLYYTVRIVNVSNDKVKHPVVIQPVPANTTLLEKTVTGTGATLSYSIDGGKTFISQTDLHGVSAGVATAPRVTHIRWQFRHPLAPHVTVLARFCAVFD